MELPKNLTVEENETIIISEGTTLEIPEDKTLINNGTIICRGKIEGKMIGNPPLYQMGDFLVQGTPGSYVYKGDTLTIKDEDVTISMAPDVQQTSTDRIVVEGNASVTLKDVNIQFKDGGANIGLGDGTCAFEVKRRCNLILEGDNTLESGWLKAGLQVEERARLTIDGMGSLTATGGGHGAGIGGSSGESGGTITINGGTVTAQGSQGGAGIGGGDDGSGGILPSTPAQCMPRPTAAARASAAAVRAVAAPLPSTAAW